MRNMPFASLLILCGSTAALVNIAAGPQNRPEANNTTLNNADVANESAVPEAATPAVQNTLSNAGDDQPPGG